MYKCPNCNGNLKFHIPSQMLRCDFCLTEMDPYAVQKDRDAVEENFYEATVFTCPECGGELLSTDNEATSFCSFCGGSTILDSRISREKRPDYIIPFQKTKDDCKKAWKALMRHAIFAPKELKSEQYIDSFRGIYMPYWVYHITQQGNVHLDGKKSYRRGDYIITEHYDLSCRLSGDYNGLANDGSSSFADNLSEAIAPYNVKGIKKFTPSFLSGFYADTADVGQEIYQDDMMQIASSATMAKMRKVREFSRFSIDSPSEGRRAAEKFGSRFEDVKSGMFPVWFMSWRNGDRVAYTVINGQTGKVAADLPVDPKKFVIGSVVLAVPIYVLLNLFLTVKPTSLLCFAMLLALGALGLYCAEVSQIVRRDSGLDDRGALSKKQPWELPDAEEVKKSQKTKKILSSPVFLILFIVFGFNVALPLLMAPMIYLGSQKTQLFWVIPMIIGAVLCMVSHNKWKKLTITGRRPGYIGALVSLVIASVVFLINPVADAWYYAGAAVALIAVYFTLSSLISYYNVLATRKLPQFDKKGGDDRA